MWIFWIVVGGWTQAQNSPLYHFHISVERVSDLVITSKSDGTLLITNKNNRRESTIFKENTVYTFQHAFPNTKKDNLKKVFRMTTANEELPYLLEKNNPEMYSNIGQYFTIENAVYPNDYGTTSPVQNLGADYPLTYLDAMNLPAAWSITTGDPKVVIGISDAHIDSTNVDLAGRISNYMKYFDYNPKNSTCGHGTNTAALIGAIADNAYGLPGICSNCDMIAHGYGSFDYIQELVEAGAKVINASWVLCGFGNYHKNVEERINEYYEEGILIVASSGNARNCNRYLRDHASSYGYPASYKNVISVATTYGDCGHYEDCMVDDPKFGKVYWKIKDRHVIRNKMVNGQLVPINAHWATNHNYAVDFCIPSETYLPGNEDCGKEKHYGGVTSTAAAMLTGVIGLIWSANYCLASAEVESILKLTAVDIENLPGNTPFKMKLGAGRVDAYKAVKMAYDMQLEKGVVDVSGRDFYRFNFKLFSSPYQINIQNQTFRDSSTVDFKARKSIQIKAGTKLQPDQNGFVKLSIDPNLPTEECFPKTPVKRPKVERDSINHTPKYDPPFTMKFLQKERKYEIIPVENILDSDYTVEIKLEDKVVFKKNVQKTDSILIPLNEWVDKTLQITVTSTLYYMDRKIRVL